MEELKKGQKVKLKFQISSVRDYEISCSIKWVENDRVSLIIYEEDNNIIKYLHEGKELEVVIYSDKGLFLFDSIVMDSPFNTDFTIELPEERTRIQRREYIRVPIKLNLSLNKVSHSIKTETINIGGGGIRFTSNYEFKMSDIWGFILHLPDKIAKINGSGEILYSIKQGDFITSVIKFTEIGESDRNKIIKLCFEEETSRLRTRSNMTDNLKRF